MQILTAFGEWSIDTNDTATDLHNGLMWARRCLGHSEIGVGDPFRVSWTSMTDKFGRGVMEYDRSPQNKLGVTVRRTFSKTAFRNGYSRGSKTVSHAGFSDWRLPTLAEVVTITFDERWGATKITSGLDDPSEITPKIFDKSCEQQRFWTANMCWQQKEFRMLFGMKPTLHPVAWCFAVNKRLSIMDIGGELKPHEYGALLVRQTT